MCQETNSASYKTTLGYGGWGEAKTVAIVPQLEQRQNLSGSPIASLQIEILDQNRSEKWLRLALTAAATMSRESWVFSIELDLGN